MHSFGMLGCLLPRLSVVWERAAGAERFHGKAMA